ncbi:unnamed protein product, partial [Staurois parvus]
NHFWVLYFFLNRPKTTENFEKKKTKKKRFFLVFVIKFCK